MQLQRIVALFFVGWPLENCSSIYMSEARGHCKTLQEVSCTPRVGLGFRV